LDCDRNHFGYVNHALIHFFDQQVLSKEGKVSCSWKYGFSTSRVTVFELRHCGNMAARPHE